MKHPFRWIALAVGACICVLAVVLALTVSSDPHSDSNTSRLVGKRAPAFTVTSLDGTPIKSSQFAGQTVILNFWNSWCPPCRQERGALSAWYQEHKNDPSVAMVGIVREDTKKAIHSYVASEKVAWPVGFDPGAKAALDFGTRGQPETYVIGSDGLVVASKYGTVTPQLLDQMVGFAQGTN